MSQCIICKGIDKSFTIEIDECDECIQRGLPEMLKPEEKELQRRILKSGKND